jgi:DNA anti-recombination protein RmuC
MVVMRESWTDERLDEFAKRVDERFDGIDRRLDKVDSRLEALQREMNTRFESLNRMLFFGVIALSSAVLAGFGGIVTQL